MRPTWAYRAVGRHGGIDMNSQSVLYSKGKNDECMTPRYAVVPILKYIPAHAVVWCPFDKPDSAFVQMIGKTNKVIHSHIDDGRDFYKWQPDEHWDMIVSNPPFTNKRKIFERALALGKPFALIMSNVWLNDSAPKQVFRHRHLELLMFDRRIKFICGGVVRNKITFSSSYFCHNVLPAQIVMESLSETKTDQV